MSQFYPGTIALISAIGLNLEGNRDHLSVKKNWVFSLIFFKQSKSMAKYFLIDTSSILSLWDLL